MILVLIPFLCYTLKTLGIEGFNVCFQISDVNVSGISASSAQYFLLNSWARVFRKAYGKGRSVSVFCRGRLWSNEKWSGDESQG